MSGPTYRPTDNLRQTDPYALPPHSSPGQGYLRTVHYPPHSSPGQGYLRTVHYPLTPLQGKGTYVPCITPSLLSRARVLTYCALSPHSSPGQGYLHTVHHRLIQGPVHPSFGLVKCTAGRVYPSNSASWTGNNPSKVH